MRESSYGQGAPAWKGPPCSTQMLAGVASLLSEPGRPLQHILACTRSLPCSPAVIRGVVPGAWHGEDGIWRWQGGPLEPPHSLIPHLQGTEGRFSSGGQ